MLNRVQLIGNLGGNPELKQTQVSTLVTFGLATTENYKDKSGEKKKETTWHNIVIWGKLADIAAQYLKKGSKIYLEGKIRHEEYTDKEGVKKYATKIVCSTFKMLDNIPSGSTHNAAPSAAPETQGYEPDDDLPF